MRQAGGIIAIIAGTLAVLAAGFTLAVGGLGSALEVDGAGTAVMRGLGGALFSLLAIALGAAVLLAVETRLVAVLMILCAVGGAVLGGNAVATFMIPVLIGGVLALFDKKKPARRQADRRTLFH